MLLAAVVWTQWMGVGIAVLVIGATIATIIGYLRSVVRPKYPPRGSGPG
jgi:hypothetical protein